MKIVHLIKEQISVSPIISLIQNYLFHRNIIIQLSFYKKMHIIYDFYQYKVYSFNVKLWSYTSFKMKHEIML